ncbi:ABC transporter permease [Mycobacterium stomatepiae]|uniref:Transport permease protein n=1 Tax=Mycobacterium stomatepiae TaxID=470076 RepID=A0A7I7Q4H7_9MYCO|nr:ABC transporter permease [Mycobacterium stomatepiae]MCV7165089.1 ABC transporter permease [Mycobacterium stomatepiae]BBY20972.1 putative doxorubicin resistance ABC transporter permease protein DrrC [Mycobacterium stomatepiae]
MTSHAADQGSLLNQSWLQAIRLLIRWRRDRAVLMGSLLLPVFLLLLYQVVLGEQVRKVTGVDSLYGLVPFCAVLSALFGALGNAVGITMDRQSGLLSRMWVLPVHRASALTGRLTAEAARTLVGTVLITALGVMMGLRFKHGVAGALLYILTPSIMVVGFTALVIALVLRTTSPAVLTWIMGGTVTLAFVNPGTTPIGMFPEWLRPFVRYQPISPPIETMRSLAYDGPIVWPLAMTVLWTVAMLVAFVPVGLRGYRICAETSNL